MDQSNSSELQSSHWWSIRTFEFWRKKYFGSCKVLCRNSKRQFTLLSNSKGFYFITIAQIDYNSHSIVLLKVIFDFANQIDDSLKDSLNELKIEVRVNGKSDNVSNDSSDNSINKLNLDVTALMAYVSSLTCDTNNVTFEQPILIEQARRESQSSTKQFLDELFKGKW